MMSETAFQFKRFHIHQDRCAMKVNTDGILLGAWADVEHSKRILDIGTGTGLIALMLAQRTTEVQIDAVEIDASAATQAAQNANESPFNTFLTIHNQSVQEFTKEHSSCKYDLIVSNPPFFTGGVLPNTLSREQVRHTTKLSHQDLLRCVQQLLSPAGRFCLILPKIEGLRMIELAATYQFYPAEICHVSSRPNKPSNRLLISFQRDQSMERVLSALTIYKSTTGQKRSVLFQELTEDFYL